jgi:glycosyltransferase involved in cell wall biosynthesis
VVVCCFNSAAVIGPTMAALAAQKIPSGLGYEVILIDNTCSDETVALARQAWGNVPWPVHVIVEGHPGLNQARASGVGQARLAIIQFVDDDNILAPDWISLLVDTYADRPEVGAAGGRNEPLFLGSAAEPGVKPPWFDPFASMFACTPEREQPLQPASKETLFGAGLSLRSAAAQAVFNPERPFFLPGNIAGIVNRGDDSEICLRLRLMGWKLWYNPALRLEHQLLPSKVNWPYVLRARQGGGRAEVILKMYRDLLKGERPLPYRAMAAFVAAEWGEFWEQREACCDLVKLQQEGEGVALRYHFLLGMQSGLLALGPAAYDERRSTIQTMSEAWKIK